MGKNAIRTLYTVIDALLAALLVAVTSTSLREDVAHEWLGIALVILMAGHFWLNRAGLLRPLARLVDKKPPTAQGMLQLVIDILLIALLACMAGSSIVISQHALWWLPQLPGAADARALHLSCSYWIFALSFVHAGLHVRKLPHWAACIAVAAAGIWAGWQLNLLPYLLLQVDYPIVDLTTPLALIALEHALIAALAALTGALLKRAAKAADARRAKATGATGRQSRKS